MKDYNLFLFDSIKSWEHNKDYYNVVATFDTETSTNPDKTFSYIILWQFYINGIAYMGRDITSFQLFIDTLNGYLKYNLIVYVHNFNYEWQFIRKYFKWDKVFAGDTRELYTAQTGKFIFKDSLKLSGLSLAKTCEGQKIQKAVGDWDYNIIRTPLTELTETELYYAENDVLCLAEYIEGMKQKYKTVAKIPLTKTGITRKNYRDYIKQELKQLDNSGSGKRPDGYNYYYRRYIKKCIPNLDTFYKLRKAYWGGFTHASLLNVGKTLKNITSYDITSSYPTVMIAEKFPYKYYTVNAERFNYYWDHKEDYSIIGLFRLQGLESVTGWGYIPTYKIINVGSTLDDMDGIQREHKNYISDNGKLYKTFSKNDYIDIYLTEIDLQLIKQVYKVENIKAIGQLYISKKEYLPEVFRNFILKQYAIKTELKDVTGKEEEYQSAKADINCLYGMTVTDPIRNQFECSELCDIVPTELKREDFDSETEFYKALEDLDKTQLHNAYKQRSHPIGLYQWGVYVSAYARKNLLEIILKLDKNDFIYSDTDSIKLLHGEKYKSIVDEYNKEITRKLNINKLKYTTAPKTIKGIKKPLGVYDFEYKAEKFKCLRAKTYIYTVNNNLHCTVAGVPKKRIKKWLEIDKKNIFRNFKNGLKIPFDFDSTTQKLGSVYQDEEKMEIINGCKCSAKSSLVLNPLDFQIGNDWIYLELYEQAQNKHRGLLY